MHHRLWVGLSVVIAVAASCSRSPVAPTPITGTPTEKASLSGSWVGTYLASCPTAPNCGQVGSPGPPPGPQQFSLLLQQDRNTLSGQINLGGWLSRVADLTGTIAADGTIALQGGMTWPARPCQPAGGWRLMASTLRYDANADAIRGTFSFVTQKHLSSCYYAQELQVDATSVSLSRGTLAAPTFTGHWQGTLVPTRCSTVGWIACYPEITEGQFELNLVQEGAAVSGALGFGNSLPVSGTADGDMLRLTARRTTVVSGGVTTERVVDWVTRRDAAGRLTGSYRLVNEIAWNAGPNAGTTWSTTYDIELRSVARVPW